MKGITSFAVKYPISVLMITLGISLLGVISYTKLGTDLFPDLNNPSLFIELEAGERPPEEIEKQFVTRVESQASRQNGVKSVSSRCQVGKASITVVYNWDQDMDEAFLDLSRAMSSFSANDEIENLTVSRYDANSDPIMEIAVTNNAITDMNELRKVAENFLRNELVRLDGVADIQINGAEKAYIKISTDSYLMDAYKVNANTIASKIKSLGQTVSGGTVLYNDYLYSVQGSNALATIDDIKNVIVSYKTTASGKKKESKVGAAVYLKDIADIELCNAEPENICRYNGQRCLSMNIFKENKFNTIEAISNIEKELERIKETLDGYEFHVISNQGNFINASIGEVKETALMGIILAVIVLFLFLRKVNVTLIMSISIPVSIIATFNLMYFNGLTINIMTLGGLALGAGMLIDNAIVVMENIFRHMENGVSPNEASINGTSEVGGAIISSTLTTIVVFLPIVYIQGAAGELFKEQAWTVSYSLISSLFVAILIIPMLASKFLKNSNSRKINSVRINGYGQLVGKLIDHRKQVILYALILGAGSYLTLPYITSEFMPAGDSKEFTITLTMAPGTRLEATAKATRSIENIAKEIGGEDVEWIYSHAGPNNTESISGGLKSENQSEIKIKLKGESPLDVDAFISSLIENSAVPDGVEISYKKEQYALQTVLGTNEAPVVVEVKGDELNIIDDLTKEIATKMDAIQGIYGIRNAMEDGAPEVEIKMDRLKCGIYGINIGSISNYVKERLNGTDAGTYEYKGEQIAMTIRVPETDLTELNDLIVESGNNQYRLSELAEIKVTKAPKEITRSNQIRIGKISAMLEGGYSLSDVTPHIREIIDGINFPSHYSAQITGEEEKRAESFNGLSVALILSIILVYMVMAAQFESLRHPFTILFSIPFAGVGSILALLITDTSLNMMAFIGVIMLAGIAVNNAIILVDAANKLKEKGLATKEAVMQAAQQRIRPILMTTLTTILALLPMSFGFGEGASLRAPMAIVVIGGLTTSTLMTLVVIPCVYYIFDPKKK